MYSFYLLLLLIVKSVRAICGVGLLESFWNNNVSGINKKILYKTLFGWIATCIFVGILTAQGIYSPIL